MKLYCTLAADRMVANLKAVALFASKDQTRAHINSVRFEVFDGALRLIATDGHCLWANDAFVVEAPSKWADAFCVLLGDVERTIKTLSAKGLNVEVWSDGKAVEFRQGGAIVSSRIADVRFPPFEQVIPDALPADTKRGLTNLDAAFLDNARKAFTLLSKVEGKRAVGLTLHAGEGSLDPCLIVDEDNPSALLVVMPRRVRDFRAAGDLARRYKRSRGSKEVAA